MLPGQHADAFRGRQAERDEAARRRNRAGSLLSVALRPARPGDAALIATLIRELAAYERLSDRAVAGEAEILASLFGEPPQAEVRIAAWEAEPAGLAVFFHNYSTFLGRHGIYLEDLYVRPAFRGRGIGRALLGELARIALERGCGRLEWAVLDWNETAIRFYRSLGATPLSGWTVFRLEGDALSRLGRS
ncbi:MAG TPA: GNAT family N-acetyltransferase [Candidatus Sulfotelmatobacter sp.]|nr:GNAT family N-acetyltransferase [Candidatus Sulfotelmatobacter sp.]